METKEVLFGRRSIRKYKSDPIPRAVLTDVLSAACHAPSAVNLQHWYFVVVESPDKMAELKKVMRKVSEKFHPVLAKRFASHQETIQETETFLSSLGHAPVCVLAFFLKPDYPERDVAMQSVSAAIENLLLAAWDSGLGGCWVSAPLHAGVGQELQEMFAPAHGEFVAAITLGYPELVPKMPPRRDGRYTFV